MGDVAAPLGTTSFQVAPLWLNSFIPKSQGRVKDFLEQTRFWGGVQQRYPNVRSTCAHMCVHTYMLCIQALVSCVTRCLFGLFLKNRQEDKLRERVLSPQLFPGPDLVSVQKCVALCVLGLRQ